MNADNTVIVLTACVNPRGMLYTALQDVNIRQKQYEDTLAFYLKNTEYKIVLVENTLSDLGYEFKQEISTGRLEYITFDGNNFDRSLGKGFGEAQMLSYALNNSKLLKSYPYFIKITGRLIVKNINSLSKIIISKESKKIIACNIRPSKKLATSTFFIVEKDFFSSYFISRMGEIDDRKGNWFEHILYSAIIEAKKDGYKSVVFPFPIKVIGVSGTTAKSYPKITIKDYILSLGAFVLYNWFGFMKF